MLVLVQDVTECAGSSHVRVDDFGAAAVRIPWIIAA